MLRTTLKSLAARKLRLLMTALAIVLGVTFVTGTLVLMDTSAGLFDEQFAQATAGIDLVVRQQATFDSAAGVEVEREPVAAETLERIRRTEGVAGAAGIVRGSAPLVVDGAPIDAGGATMGLSWAENPYSAFELRSGRPPATDGEVVVDRATAADADIGVGDEVAVSLSEGLHVQQVVGVATFGDADGVPNSTVALFAPHVAQRLYGLGDSWSEVHVVADGVTAETLRERLQPGLDDDLEIAASQDTAAASAAAAQEDLLYLRMLLYILAATALLVGAFMIANTFTIVVAQRTREFATLRALGASGRQVLTTVLVEAVTVGAAASAAGTALGIASAVALRSLAGAFGVVIPDGGLRVQAPTLAVGFGVGLLMTVAAAVVPARRAARTSPVAAMREGTSGPRAATLRRVVAGGALVVAGAAGLLVGGLVPSIPVTGGGGISIVLGTVVLAPAFAGRFAAGLGALMPGGLVVRLARTNVRRASRRTAATSTALALGVAVVTFMTVVATSAKAGIGDAVDDVVDAELVVESARGEMLGGLSPHVFDRVRGVQGVQTASRLRYGHWLDDGTTRAVTAIDPDTFPAVADMGMVAGDLAALRTGGIVLADNVAASRGLDVGDDLTMQFSRGGNQRLEVVGIADAEDSAVTTGYVISLDTYARLFTEDVDVSVYLKLAEGADPEAVRGELDRALSDFPTAAVHDQAAAKASMTSMLDSMLGLVTVLLVLAVLIALLGITNALALSIIERTSEVGLLRAVGMTRPQLRWMVRAEAALTAAVGAVLGVGLGIVVAAATTRALGGLWVLPLTVPVTQLAAYLAIATLGGIAAGLLPGRRAARMDVLNAIATG